jgi:hypothetical protein
MARLPVVVIAVAGSIACGHPRSEVASNPQPAAATDSSQHAIGVGTATMLMTPPRRGIERFAPAFPATEAGGVCEYLPPEARRPDEWVASMTFPSDSNPTRRVTVRYDSSGVLTYYSDERGDETPQRVATGSDGSPHLVFPSGRRTEVIIVVSRGFGFARNVGGGEAEESFRDSIPVMLAAENLGSPGRMAERIRTECR